MSIEKLSWLTEKEVLDIANTFGTPVFVYDQEAIRHQANTLLSINAPYGKTIRYAVKANPHAHILQLLDREGLHFDASSYYEVLRCIEAGIDPSHILLTSQQVLTGEEMKDVIDRGVLYTATSLTQLEVFGRVSGGGEVSVRINPGVGIGATKRTNTGGRDSSFGIWHEYIEKIHEIAKKYNLKIVRVHTHIGTGGDPEVWRTVAVESIGLLKHFPDAHTINLGGGFKVARMSDESYMAADVSAIGEVIGEALKEFGEKEGREIVLELEPGTYTMANSGVLITKVHDIVDTGKDGYTFVKLNAGMNDILRPGMYGAQHPLIVVGGEEKVGEFVYVGHNCESGDIWTPKPGDPESIAARKTHTPTIDSLVVVGGAGAYCAAMNASGYNSFPSSGEVLRTREGEFVEISRKGDWQEHMSREI